MTISPNRRLIPALAVCTFLAWPAAAQEAAPTGDAIMRPLPLAPGSGNAQPSPQDMPAAFGRAPGPDVVKVDPLATIDIDAAGALTPATGGHGRTMWEGTRREIVDSLLPRLPVGTTSPALRDMMRRLLLSEARPPEGNATQGDLIAMRIKLLADMGELEGAAALLAAVPSRSRAPSLIRLEADELFLKGEVAPACGLVANQIQASDEAYWQKALAFCQVLAGEGGKALLGADLLREMGEDDQVFFLLLESLGSGQEAKLASLADATPLHLAMARTAKAQLPPDVVFSSRPGILQALGDGEMLPPILRLLAAERAEAKGALPVDALRLLYAAQEFGEDLLASPISAAEALMSEGGVESELMARALLYRTALDQNLPAARAEAVAAALNRAGRGGYYPTAARVLMPAMEKLEPSAAMIWLAPNMVRALAVGQRLERAGAWYRLVAGNAGFNPESARMAALLKPALRLAGAREAEDWSPRDLAAWIEAAGSNDTARDRASLIFSMLEGLGDFVPDGLWDRVAAGEPVQASMMPHASLWQRLELAGRRGRLGEVLLLSLVFIGEDGPTAAHPLVLRRIVEALRGVGQEHAARAIAVEAAVEAAVEVAGPSGP